MPSQAGRRLRRTRARDDGVPAAASCSKLGRAEAAVATYDVLAERKLAPVDGLPSALVARVGRASVYDAGSRTSALRAEAAALRDDLLADVAAHPGAVHLLP